MTKLKASGSQKREARFGEIRKLSEGKSPSRWIVGRGMGFGSSASRRELLRSTDFLFFGGSGEPPPDVPNFSFVVFRRARLPTRRFVNGGSGELPSDCQIASSPSPNEVVEGNCDDDDDSYDNFLPESGYVQQDHSVT